MYGIFTYIYHKSLAIHVGKYTIPMDPSWVPFQKETSWGLGASIRPISRASKTTEGW